MPNINHWQFAELPVRRFTLTFDTGTPPALHATDKVTMLLRQDTTDVAIALTPVDLASRTVDVVPTGPLNTTPGVYPFVIRVTDDQGNSYNHPDPEDEQWTWTIKATPTQTDVADPA